MQPVRKILLVDDEPHVLYVLAEKLRATGRCAVFTAADGREALTLVLQETPDLVVTDFQMPCLDGVELAQAMASSEETREIPIVLLTARGFAVPQAALTMVRIVDVVAKPFSPRELVTRILELLSEEQPALAASES